MEVLERFIQHIAETMQREDSREESYYPALETLISSLGESLHQREIHVTTLPKWTEAGNPDFRIWDGSHRVTGYIEAKRPDADLSRIEDSEQLQRYRSTFPNLILTDFFEYRLYKDGELVNKVSIGRPYVVQKLGEIPPVENLDAFRELMEQFFSHSVPRTLRASSLARELAKRTRFLEHVIEHELTEEENRELTGFYQAFRKYLIAGLGKEQFADLYAQTVTYGLFAARTRAEGTFTRQNARKYIPKTIGILRDVFDFIAYHELPENIGWIVDDIAEVLNAADINKILKRYLEEGRGQDPIIHFYETFLSEYNPRLRERRGVYYTPEPVVKYIVRSVHRILKEEFDKPLGLADSSVTVLDPAAGTLTFIAEAFKLAVSEYGSKYGRGDIRGFIKDHLLQNFYAFELMMAPYAIGHLKMGFVLEELGYKLPADERFQLYLTNSLEMEKPEQTELPGMASLSEESHMAGTIKKDEDVLVIIGNPPYSVNSYNTGEWIDRLLKEGYTHENGNEDDGYYRVDGKPLGERNPKMLQDDYVKFIRFAQWKIDQLGHGIVSMITNHGYLENPTFRGMRKSLMHSFDEISLLDLHGNARKKETAPDGSRDENVFDIQQGVAVHIMVKNQELQKRVQKADLYGLQEEKYEWLQENQLQSNAYEEINPQSPFYLFTDLDYDLGKRYQQYIRVTDLFPVYSTGIKTHRDEFVADFDENALRRRISTFLDTNRSDEEVRTLYHLHDNRDWKLSKKRRAIQRDPYWRECFTNILYRPFDIRHIFYHQDAIDFGREEIMQHYLTGDNLGLVSVRQVAEEQFNHSLLTDTLVDTRVMFSSRGAGYTFPLYLYPNPDSEINNSPRGGSTLMMVFEKDAEYAEWQPNINKEYYNLLENTYGKRPSPEKVLYYTYGVLYAPAYRQTYAEFLKSDFPRIPFTRDDDLFTRLAESGKELADLHLMRSDKLNDPMARFQGDGNNVIAKSKKVGRDYRPDEERVYINEDGQYFEGIQEEVWNCQIGGYQVLDKWLYDRRERRLGNEEIQHYCRIVTALYHTLDLQKRIDEVYPAVEENVIPWEEG